MRVELILLLFVPGVKRSPPAEEEEEENSKRPRLSKLHHYILHDYICTIETWLLPAHNSVARKTNFQDLYSKSLYTTPPLIAVALLLFFVSLVCLVGTNCSSSMRFRKLKDSTEKYASHLKIFYQKYTQKVSKWPPSNIKKHSRLAVIKKESNDTSTFNAETIHGCIDDIICGKEEIEIKELFVTDDDLKIVLVDGAPGIGKSTLALHICQLWANDECFTEYDLVVLLRFRDKAVREAKDVHDLFQYPDSNNMEDVVEDIKSPKGPNLLLVLDGYDELLCEQSQNHVKKAGEV